MFGGSTQARLVRWGAAAAAGLLSLGLLNTAALAAPPQPGKDAPGQPLVQQFEDVPNSNGFSSYINNLYLDGVISGYACGGAGEPCVPAANLPYYRPNNGVTRAQMAKFVDNGRRNISNAVGISLSLLNSGASRPLYAQTTTNGEAVHGDCLTAGVPCYGVEGNATNLGNYGGVFYGSLSGVYGGNIEAGGYGVQGYAVDGQGVYGTSTNQKGVLANSGNAGSWSLYVNAAGGNHGTSSTHIEGTLFVEGGCNGCLGPNVVQNVGAGALEVGDVVSIVGSITAAVGEQPVVTVKQASSANDTAVAGVVGSAMYVPDAALVTQYKAEQAAQQAAIAQHDAALAAGNKAGAAAIAIPAITVNGKDTEVRTLSGTTAIASNGYAGMLTTGAVPAVKVDASFGAIHAGDLLVASSHAGYAMKAGKDIPAGAVLGKALGTLESGTGLVAMLITSK